MNLPLHILLAAAALAWGGLLTVGHAQGADSPRAIEAREARIAAIRSPWAARPNAQPAAALTAAQRRDGFERLCTIKPVMTDADLAGCKRAFEIY